MLNKKSALRKGNTDPLTIRQNLLWNTAGCLTYQMCQWSITVLVVVLSSGYDNSGILAYAMAIGNIFFPIATYNMRTFQVSDLRGEFSSENYIAFRLFTVLGALVFVLAYVALTASSLSLVLATSCWLVFKADESFCNVYYGIDQKAGRMDYIGISQGLRGLVILVLFCFVLCISGEVNWAIVSMSLGCMAITLFYDAVKTRGLASIRPSITGRRVVTLLRKCLPSVLTLVCYGAVVSVSRQMFEGMYGAELLGIYAAVATPTVIVQVAASYLYSPFLSSIAKQWLDGDVASLGRSIAKILGIILSVFVVLFALAGIWGSWGLQLLFGSSISDYTYLLQPALVATAVSALMGFMLDVLIVFRYLNLALLINVSSLGVCLFACPHLIGAFGMNGINYTIIGSFACGITLGAIALAWKMRKQSRSHDGAR